MTRTTLALILVATLAAAGGYYAWSRGNAAALDIETAPAIRADVRRVVATSGAVRALVTVEVGSQLSGQISRINVDYSTGVKAGEVLARIEPSTLETKVREAEAAIAIAQATVELQQATLIRAEVNLRKTERDFGRSQELAERGSVSAAALDAARAGKDSAQADIAIAKAQVENAKATLAQRRATLESARIELERTFIRSPIDGVVIERAVEVGQTVAATMTAPKLFTIAQDLNRIQIDAQVDEADIGQVANGNTVAFGVDAYPDINFTGAVDQIRLAPTNLQNVVTYTVVISANNPGGRLLPGMTANVEIVTGVREGVLTVPNEALRFQPRGAAMAMTRATSTGGPAPNRGAGALDRMLERLQSQLDLNAREMVRVRGAVADAFQDLDARSGAGGTADQGEIRAQMRTRLAKALKGVLTAEQYRKYEDAQRRAGTGPRRATVWTLEKGTLVQQQIRIGLSDGNVTEVVDGLAPDARVVTRVREKAS